MAKPMEAIQLFSGLPERIRIFKDTRAWTEDRDMDFTVNDI
jgi:hypothetical protein